MKAPVPLAIILVTAVAVVIGANAVTGERGAEPGPAATESKGEPSPPQDGFIHGYDPECVNEPADGEPLFIPLECMRLPGQPDRTPLGWKPVECPPDLTELDPELCDWDGEVSEPDFGPVRPTITINGQVIELPDDHTLGTALPSGVTTITIGDSWVKYNGRGVLRDSHIEPGDEETFRPILDALTGE